MHFNARSLYPKFDELSVLCVVERPDIVCITVTWFHTDILQSECLIPGYECVGCDRDGRGGGVAIYVHCDLNFEIVSGLPPTLELIVISVFRASSPNRKSNLAVWYRPPGDILAFDTLHIVS